MINTSPKTATTTAVHHYIVHGWEDTYYPENALNSSNVLETLTPSASHTNHMPGHIYFLTGDYKKAHDVFLNSYNVDLEYMNKYNVGMENNWEVIHNLAFMVSNLAEAGRYREAIQYSLIFQTWQLKNPQIQVLDFSPDISRSAARYFFTGLRALAFVYFRYSDWESYDVALYMIITKYSGLFNATVPYLTNYFEALRVWGQGMNFIKLKHFEAAQNSANQLLALITILNNTMSEVVAYDYSVVVRSFVALKVQHAELVALCEFNGTHYDSVIKALQYAAYELEDYIPYNEPSTYPRPVLTSVAETYIAYAQLVPDRSTELLNKAIDTYNEILESPLHAKSGFALFGIGYCYQLMKDTQRAKDSYNTFLEAWSDADENLPQVLVAKTYIENVSNNNTDQTYFWIMIALAVVVAVLGLVLIIVVYKYISRKNEYRAIPERT